MREKCDGDCLNCRLPDCTGIPAEDAARRPPPEKAREYASRRRARLGAVGLCTQCGVAPARPGKRLCAACAKAGAERRAAYYELRAARGLCVQCGKEPPKPGRKECPACLEKLGTTARRRAAALKAAGLCVACAKEPPRPGRTMCARCAERQAGRSREARERKRKEARDGTEA